MEAKIFDTGMYIIDNEHKILYLNAAAAQMYPEIKVGDVCHEAFARLEAPCENCPIGKGTTMFYSFERKEWIEAQSADMPIHGYGNCKCIQYKIKQRLGDVSSNAITADPMSEYVQQLQRENKEVAAIATYCEPASPFFFATEPFLKMLGYRSVEELVARIDGLGSNLVHPDDKAKVREDIKNPYTVGATYDTLYRMPHSDGSWVWIFSKGKIVRADKGRIVTVTVCTPMSDFMKEHEELEEEQERSAHMLYNIPGGYHRCANEIGLPFLYVSRSFEKILGWTHDEIKRDFDNKFLNLVYPEDIGVFEKQLTEMVDNQAFAIYRMKAKDGGYRWVQDSTMLVENGSESYYQCIIADITKHIEALNEATLRAEAGSRAKSAFLFNASHDIRTPMNAILGFADIIEASPDNAELVCDSVAKIKQSGKTLMKLLNDVLELSRIESGKDVLDTAPTDIEKLANDLYTMFLPEIEAQGLDFKMDNSIRDRYVMADSLKLTRIMMNMLSNAKKFTARGGRIVFGIEELPVGGDGFADYRLFVRDTGIGMSAEFRKKAFEQFERERTSTVSGITGSGLGLAIIKRLVDIMGGVCEIESELGEGTEISAIVRLDFAEFIPEELKSEGKTDALLGRRALLVEDNALNREIARFQLESLGFSVEEAENGSEAVKAVLKRPAGYYDIILMDIQMPIMDGYTATREIRSLSGKKALVPIVAMTANAFSEDRVKCLELGMNEHIGKPIDPKRLASLIATVIK